MAIPPLHIRWVVHDGKWCRWGKKLAHETALVFRRKRWVDRLPRARSPVLECQWPFALAPRRLSFFGPGCLLCEHAVKRATKVETGEQEITLVLRAATALAALHAETTIQERAGIATNTPDRRRETTEA